MRLTLALAATVVLTTASAAQANITSYYFFRPSM